VIEIKQRIIAGTSSPQKGDCFKCCIASILELPYESVPHFVQGEWVPSSGPTDYTSAANDWLKVNGWPLRLESVRYFKQEFLDGHLKQDPEDLTNVYERLPHPKEYRFGQWWIGGVISENYPGCLHAIVMRERDVVFDPSTLPRRTPYEFVGGYYFVPTEPWRCRS